MNLGLQRIESLLLKMDNPQLDFPSIHVAEQMEKELCVLSFQRCGK